MGNRLLIMVVSMCQILDVILLEFYGKTYVVVSTEPKFQFDGLF